MAKRRYKREYKKPVRYIKISDNARKYFIKKLKTKNIDDKSPRLKRISSSAQKSYKKQSEPVKAALIIVGAMISCIILVFVVRGCEKAQERRSNTPEVYQKVLDDVFKDIAENEMKDALDNIYNPEKEE